MSDSSVDIPLNIASLAVIFGCSRLPHFEYRHIFPLLIAAGSATGGLWPFFKADGALLKFGFNEEIAASKTAHPVIKISSARDSTIGLTMLGLYIGGHLEALDIAMAAAGWIAMVDYYVLQTDGSGGSAIFRGAVVGSISLWGLLGVTTGKYF